MGVIGNAIYMRVQNILDSDYHPIPPIYLYINQAFIRKYFRKCFYTMRDLRTEMV